MIPLAHPDRNPQLPLTEWLDVDRQTAKCTPVAACVFEQRLVLGDPDVATLAPAPAIAGAAGLGQLMPGTARDLGASPSRR